ncbi:energy-coupling factor transporter transmembrane protein EcfT [Crassaminicella thermophila]|uniref:Energy-coupling factor transporter transmembrane protein EcfT n=1 Tax=Crassaminicella thermophila TaxID=2599308 RepID=A0A5C0SBT6_CRATE|nr:energy-coupling factor transporter transmembrane component T [Crassaminicella thermophila]QEK11387.1 energy-coupling factor transporter transmembrane protein EcfT [Crassaminicella thermophila]
MMLVYREKDNLIYKLHPITMISFIFVVFILSLVFSHPVYLLGLFFAVAGVIITSGNFSEWKIYLKFTVVMIIVILIVNAIFVHAGSTVLISGPRLPVLGKVQITMEALAFGIGMGIRLLVITSIFCLYTYAVHPDKVMKIFSRWGNKSILIITLATRLFPLMVRDYQRITEVQRCRGVKFDTGKWWNRAKNLLPVISVLLLSCLERSFQLAESMYARGYGSGNRSCYSRDLWRPRDYIILFTLFISMGTGIWAALKGWASYGYYPKLERFNLKELYMVVVVMISLMFPVILNWGWKRWPILRSKI